MRLFSILMCLMFTFTTTRVSGTRTEEYVDLISEVYKFYKSSSIIFFYSSETDVTEKNEVSNIAGTFAKIKIPTILLTFEKFFEDKVNITGTSQTQLPMIVTFLTTEKSLGTYFEVAKKINSEKSSMKYRFPLFRHLTIFMKIKGKNEKPLLDFCTNPVGNPMNLRFDSRLIVKCYDELEIREWYSVIANETNFNDLAKWDMERGLMLETGLAMFERRGGLRGKKLRITSIKNDSSFKREGNELKGYIGRILEIMRRSLNFTMDFVSEEDTVGILDESTGKWSGMINHLIEGEADLVATDMTLTAERLRYVDCSTSLVLAQNFLYIKKPRDSLGWIRYIKPFDSRIWFLIGMSVLVAPILLTLMKMKIRKFYILSSLISENYLNVWGIFCQQGLTEFPTATALRIAYFSIFCLSLIIWSAYSASLISIINVPNIKLPFESLDGFLADGSYKMIVLQDSAAYAYFKHTATDKVSKAMKDLILERDELPGRVKDGFDMVCRDKVAFYVGNNFKKIVNDYIKCAVYEIPTNKFSSIGLLLPKNSEYTEVINYYIQKLKDYGLLDRLEHFCFKKFKNLQKDPLSQNVYKRVELTVVALPLAIVICGCFLGVLIFCLEMGYSYCKDEKNPTQSDIQSLSTAMDSDECSDLEDQEIKTSTEDIMLDGMYFREYYEHRLVYIAGSDELILEM